MAKRKIIDEDGVRKLDQLKVSCRCGHTAIIPVFKDSIICNVCGNKILNTTKLHFMYKLRRKLNNEEDRGQRR